MDEPTGEEVLFDALITGDPGGAIERQEACGVYGPAAAPAIRDLLRGIHEMCIEIDRCHERMARAEARVAALEQLVAAGEATKGGE